MSRITLSTSLKEFLMKLEGGKYPSNSRVSCFLYRPSTKFMWLSAAFTMVAHWALWLIKISDHSGNLSLRRIMLFLNSLLFLNKVLVTKFHIMPSTDVTWNAIEHCTWWGDCTTVKALAQVYVTCFNQVIKIIPLYNSPMLGIVVFLPTCWMILDNLEFFTKILDFLYFVPRSWIFLILPRSWQLILPRNSRKIKISARNPRSCHWKSEKKTTVFL